MTRQPLGTAALVSVILGVTGSAIAPLMLIAPNTAQAQTQTQNQTQQQAQQTVFPDVDPNYWAYPFIRELAERNILAGYPDGTYRPEDAIERDEFASAIRSAFNQDAQRNIEDGSAFQDVPENYWAESDIEAAYQQGFMERVGENQFRPRQTVSRLDAVRALASGIDLSEASVERPRRTATLPPMASTVLMQPLLAMSALRQVRIADPAPAAQTVQEETGVDLNEYYLDAERIPDAAREPVKRATAANIVVNHPNPRLFEPDQPLRRSTAAAMIHQAMVYQGRADALPEDSAAHQYVARPGEDEVAVQE